MKKIFGFLIFLFLVSCTADGSTSQSAVSPLPTLRPTAETVTVEADEPSPNSSGDQSSADQTSQSSENVDESAPPSQPEQPVDIEVKITSPELAAVSGRTLDISGRLQIGRGQTAEAVLVAPDGTLLGAIPVKGNEFSTFSAEIPTASWFSGMGTATVTVFDVDGTPLRQDSQQVQIKPDTSQERYLTLYRPSEGETAGVSGYYLFFDGYAERPAGFRVAITLLGEDCATQIARQTYAMRGSGYWQGFIVVPEEVSGMICALISFGEEGSSDRREIQIPIEVLPVDVREAPAVLIGNPPPGSEAAGGRSLNTYGTAYRAPSGQVDLTLLLGDGTIAATDTAVVNRYGYWEVDLLLPVNLNEEALLRVTIGPIDDPLAADEIFLQITNNQ